MINQGRLVEGREGKGIRIPNVEFSILDYDICGLSVLTCTSDLSSELVNR